MNNYMFVSLDLKYYGLRNEKEATAQTVMNAE
jgi:hypothetical protein